MKKLTVFFVATAVLGIYFSTLSIYFQDFETSTPTERLNTYLYSFFFILLAFVAFVIICYKIDNKIASITNRKRYLYTFYYWIKMMTGFFLGTLGIYLTITNILSNFLGVLLFCPPLVVYSMKLMKDARKRLGLA